MPVFTIYKNGKCGPAAKRRRYLGLRVRILTYLDDREDARLAHERLLAGEEGVPLEQLIEEFRAEDAVASVTIDFSAAPQMSQKTRPC